MEKFLNLVWLLLALSLSAAWLWQRMRSSSRYLPAARLQAIALVCLLVVLFFPVSISDDLHWTALATEVFDTSRKLRGLATLKASVDAGHVDVAAVITAHCLAPPTTSVDLLQVVSACASPAEGFAAHFSSRAPPSLS